VDLGDRDLDGVRVLARDVVMRNHYGLRNAGLRSSDRLSSGT
jgi:hypothetical protein